ncbi:bacterio-opsin activator domain-containing protein [Halomarina halobia]|uniref:Bacterio-opsin activator domain-containing protein n=1 Tax=Halomarina halobia TaxID=3033386 RepID=A0ABD6A6T5_9EURY|nr:bacterio-opsin activator domain-containing protein [Halomarina sp. PSR21]
MTVVAQVAIAANAFDLGEVLSTGPPVDIELTQFVPIDARPAPFIWVETPDVAAFETVVRRDPRVGSLTRHDTRAGKTLYHIEWDAEINGLLGVIEEFDVLVERGHGTAERWTFQLRLPDHTSLRTFHARCRDENLPLHVNWISGTAIRTDPADASAVESGREGARDSLRRGAETETSGTIDREPLPASVRERTTPFRQIVENLDVVIWMTDPNKEEVIYVNPVYEEVWGQPRERLYDEPLAFLDAIHPDDRERVRAALASQPDGVYDEEYRLKRPDGEIRWIRDRAVSIRDTEGNVSRIAGIAEDVTEQKERERALDQTSQILGALATSFPDLAFVIDEDGYYREYLGGPETESLLYEEPGEFLEAQLCDVLPADIADQMLSVIRRCLDTGELQTLEYQLEVPAGLRWFEGRITPMQHPTDTRSVVFVARDITQRKKRERVLTGLHGATRTLFNAASSEDVADIAVRTASKRLRLSFVAVFSLDESAGVLRPVAYTPDVKEILGELPRLLGPGSLAWDAFINGDTRVYDDVRPREMVYGAETPVRSELIVPLGNYGILLAGNTTTGAFDDTDTEFAELLATNTEAALHHVEYERDFERQNERLVELTRLNSVIRSINRAVVDATTRDEIASKVCENIVENESYLAAWIGEYRTGKRVTSHATAGLAEAVFESGVIPADDATLMDELAGTAHQTRAVHVTQDLHRESSVGPWHEQLLDRGCRGAVAVPLVAGEAVYGILTLYTDQSDSFDEEEITILRELGQTIGRAIRASEARRALVADTATELKFDISDVNSFFVAASGELECRLSLEGLVPLEAGRLLNYVTVDGASPDAIREWATRAANVETCRLLTETEEGGVFEFRVSGASEVSSLVDFGATVRSMVADDGEARVIAEVAPDTDTLTVLNGLREVCPSATLTGKRDLDRPLQTVHQFRETLTEQLTEKQLNALRAAYFAGYFEWPRASTAEDIADPMEVSSSTLHFHLRHAMRKLLMVFFEAQDTE